MNLRSTCIAKMAIYSVLQLHLQTVMIFTARRYASALYAVVMCLSVRPSVTNRYCIKTAKDRITQPTPYDSPGIWFSDAKYLGETPTMTTRRWRQIQGGWFEIGDF